MNPEMMLSQLAPLREPVAISWWPLALGWWVVLALTVALLAGLALWLQDGLPTGRSGSPR